MANPIPSNSAIHFHHWHFLLAFHLDEIIPVFLYFIFWSIFFFLIGKSSPHVTTVKSGKKG